MVSATVETITETVVLQLRASDTGKVQLPAVLENDPVPP
jgi:hypothetical protein